MKFAVLKNMGIDNYNRIFFKYFLIIINCKKNFPNR
jgi:hypothetical protein